jgi:hypothetical protein
MHWHYEPPIDWHWNPETECVEYTVRQEGGGELETVVTLKVMIHPKYLERHFGIPDGASPEEVARNKSPIIEELVGTLVWSQNRGSEGGIQLVPVDTGAKPRSESGPVAFFKTLFARLVGRA